MAWTEPKTWVDQESVEASEMNTELTTNMNEIADYVRGLGQAVWEPGMDVTTASDSYVTLHAFNIITRGRPVLIGLSGTLITSTANRASMAVQVDNGAQTVIWFEKDVGRNGHIIGNVGWVYQIDPQLEAGQHEIKILWRQEDRQAGRSLILQYANAFAIEMWR